MKKIIERISIFVVATAFLLGVIIVGNTDTNKNVLTSTTVDGVNIDSLLDKYQGIYETKIMNNQMWEL